MTVENDLPAAVAEAGAIVSAVEQSAAPAAPAVEVVHVAEVAAPAAAPELRPHTDIPSLMDSATVDPVEEKPAEVAKVEEAAPAEPVKPEEAKPEEKPVEVKPEAEAEKPVEVAPEPIVYDLKAPEGFEVQSEKLKEFTDILGKSRVPAEAAQMLLEMHAADRASYVRQTEQAQHDAFAQTRAGWAKQSMGDEEFGGAGWQTSIKAVARMRDLLVPPERQKAFSEFLAVTGAGDHPEFIRIMHNVAQYLDEPKMPPANPKPPPGLGQKPGKRGMRSLYNSSDSAAG